MKQSVLIVAGGTGFRMLSDIPKQFLPLDGKPALMHSIIAFQQYMPGMKTVVVLPETYLGLWENLCDEYQFILPCILVPGGITRFHSVKNGLRFIENDELVAIHDGARPLPGVGLIRRTFQTAEELGNAVPAIPVTESIREVTDGHSRPLDRSKMRIVQTPQVFIARQLKEAYLQEYSPEFTDDASVLQKTGAKINLVDGEITNIKLTGPLDLQLAAFFLAGRNE